MSRAGRAPARGDGLGAGEARRIALAAQGLADPRPAAPPDQRLLLRTIQKLGLLQLDSVSVLLRAHYLPLYARLGPYDRSLLDRLAAHDGSPPPRRQRRLFEYWAHEASLLPVELEPLLRWRMADARAGVDVWNGLRRIADERPDLVRSILAEIRDRGPLGVSELTEPGSRTGPWWGWHDGKRALEWLFWTGAITAAGRRGFERLYDLPERCLPPAVLSTPTPAAADAQRRLLAHAAGALGVATMSDLRDYYRLPLQVAKDRLAELVEAGELRPVTVEGWRQQAYLAEGARLPRRARAATLLVPFDPLIFERARTERLFGFHYRIEIYTPVEKRRHGYYVLPFLLGDRLVARVDLKAERKTGRLLVQGAFAEPGATSEAMVLALHQELHRLAAWLGLATLVIVPKGDLAPLLARLPAEPTP